MSAAPVTPVPETAAAAVDPTPINLPIAFDGNRITITNPAANRRLRRSRMSPSTAKSMEGCPARYAVERLLPRRDDPFGPAPLGTAGHAVMEALMQLPGPERTRDRVEELLLTQLLLAAPDRPLDGWPGIPADRAAEWVALVRACAAGLFDIEDPATVDVHATELHLDDVQIAGVPFNGFVDRVDRTRSHTGEPRLRVVDYKTSSRVAWSPKGIPNPHEDQIRLYIAATAQSLQLPQSHLTGAVYYTKLGKIKPVPASRSRIRDTTERFVRSWTDLNDYADAASWPCVTSPLCGWCPLVAVCPAAAADGKAARAAGLPTADQFDLPVLRPLDAPILPSAGPLPLPAARPEASPESVPDTAHVPGSDQDTDHDPRSETMSTSLLREDKAWEETAGPNAGLNPNSYAAQAAFGLASMAVQTLHAAGVVLRPSAVDEMAQTLGGIVAGVQLELTGRTSMQDGMHTRLRGALHTAMETLPPPLGGTADELRAWVEAATRRTRSIAAAAVRLWDGGEPEVPDFKALVGLKAA